MNHRHDESLMTNHYQPHKLGEHGPWIISHMPITSDDKTAHETEGLMFSPLKMIMTCGMDSPDTKRLPSVNLIYRQDTMVFIWLDIRILNEVQLAQSNESKLMVDRYSLPTRHEPSFTRCIFSLAKRRSWRFKSIAQRSGNGRSWDKPQFFDGKLGVEVLSGSSEVVSLVVRPPVVFQWTHPCGSNLDVQMLRFMTSLVSTQPTEVWACRQTKCIQSILQKSLFVWATSPLTSLTIMPFTSITTIVDYCSRWVACISWSFMHLLHSFSWL